MDNEPLSCTSLTPADEVITAAIAKRLKVELEPVVADQLPDVMQELLTALADAEQFVWLQSRTDSLA